jgi:hypothetical protein
MVYLCSSPTQCHGSACIFFLSGPGSRTKLEKATPRREDQATRDSMQLPRHRALDSSNPVQTGANTEDWSRQGRGQRIRLLQTATTSSLPRRPCMQTRHELPTCGSVVRQRHPLAESGRHKHNDACVSCAQPRMNVSCFQPNIHFFFCELQPRFFFLRITSTF